MENDKKSAEENQQKIEWLKKVETDIIPLLYALQQKEVDHCNKISNHKVRWWQRDAIKLINSIKQRSLKRQEKIGQQIAEYEKYLKEEKSKLNLP